MLLQAISITNLYFHILIYFSKQYMVNSLYNGGCVIKQYV